MCSQHRHWSAWLVMKHLGKMLMSIGTDMFLLIPRCRSANKKLLHKKCQIIFKFMTMHAHPHKWVVVLHPILNFAMHSRWAKNSTADLFHIGSFCAPVFWFGNLSVISLSVKVAMQFLAHKSQSSCLFVELPKREIISSRMEQSGSCQLLAHHQHPMQQNQQMWLFVCLGWTMLIASKGSSNAQWGNVNDSLCQWQSMSTQICCCWWISHCVVFEFPAFSVIHFHQVQLVGQWNGKVRVSSSCGASRSQLCCSQLTCSIWQLLAAPTACSAAAAL